MLSEQIRSIGVLADAIFQATIKAASLDGGDDPPPLAEVDLAAIAARALDGTGTQLLPCPHDAEAIQLAIRLAERMLATLYEADTARAAAAEENEAPDNHYSDDTGLPCPPRGRRRRSRRGRLWRVSEALCVAGEEGDMVRLRHAEFQHGATFVGLTGNTGRTGAGGECYLAPATARAIADALRERADALDPPDKSQVPRRRKRSCTTRADAAREVQDVRAGTA